MLHVHRRGYVAANVQFPFKKRIDPEQLFLARGDAAVCRQFSDMKRTEPWFFYFLRRGYY